MTSGVERWWRRGRDALGDTISRGDTKRKKIINFVGKLVKKINLVSKMVYKDKWEILSDKLHVFHAKG